jgi:hypothetical protein
LLVLNAHSGVQSAPIGASAHRESGNREEFVSDASHCRDDADHCLGAVVPGYDTGGGKHPFWASQ